VTLCRWRDRADAEGVVFEVEANRFLHHMVRFLVGTMLDVAAGRRPPEVIPALLAAPTNRGVSPPAPPHALYLDAVRYPRRAVRPGAAPAAAPADEPGEVPNTPTRAAAPARPLAAR
jgi:tRNA pseudouridine38-40 synthase